MKSKNSKKALVLFSGGLDSTTCLSLAKSQGYECHALSFNYQQRHSVELEFAQRIAKSLPVAHHIFDLPIHQWGGSALTDLTLAVPDAANHTAATGVPITYVPARNTIFLSIALGLSETIDAQTIFIGVSAIDYSGYPDCRPEYIAAFEKMAQLATNAGIKGHGTKIETPLIHLSKADTIRLGLSLRVDYSQTISCYQPDAAGRACGHCDSCALRRRGFEQAGVADPTRYQ